MTTTSTLKQRVFLLVAALLVSAANLSFLAAPAEAQSQVGITQAR
jgi:hypothetical protein